MDLGAMLAGKRVLVTGASSGLGENFARLAAGCKAKVVIGARRKAPRNSKSSVRLRSRCWKWMWLPSSPSTTPSPR